MGDSIFAAATIAPAISLTTKSKSEGNDGFFGSG